MKNKISPAVAALIVIVMIGAATAGVASMSTQKADQPVIGKNANTSGSTPSASSPSSSQEFKDGSYTADGSYSTPGGKESIGLAVTLKGDIIQDIDLEQRASGGDTAIYQAKFASGYKELVQGKDISEVKLTRVAGSSLTSNGFNEALESIKRDAAS